ncbi:acetate/propionate family kinase [Metamycoplasma buccale]|uniref:acetate/propionate family kinase n=1 Tax=Metamycoplasma buccale TaxID=55602 RepID=UPI00398F3123
MSKFLVINAGSSSIKWSLFNENLVNEAKGIAQRIKMPMGILTLDYNNEKIEEDLPLPTFLEAVKQLEKQWENHGIIKNYSEISQVAFRIVNGGPFLRDTCEVNDKNIEYLQESIDLAPVHNPGAIEAILAFQKIMPNVKKTLHFDTSFHKSIGEVEYTYPINKSLSDKLNLRKYGFHGLNYNFVTEKMEQILNKKPLNLVILHIGSGASLCAIQNSKSIDTSMGFTPLAGIMMGTRSGDIDPSLIPYIMKHENMDIDDVMKMLNEKSGMLGVSQISSDARDIQLQRKTNPQAKFTLDLYIRRISDYLIKYLNRIDGKIDAIVFTAGVGENDHYIRLNTIKNIKLLKLEIDEVLNKDRSYGEYKLISTANSEIPIYIVRANEELFIVKDAKNFFNNKN